MDCPPWITPALRLALTAQAEHAADAVADLAAITAGWDAASRSALVDRVARQAVRGMPLPAALMVALTEALDD
jgi:hypothetical protein